VTCILGGKGLLLLLLLLLPLLCLALLLDNIHVISDI
jgi:hypothetical protein